MKQKALILIVDEFKDDREMYSHYLTRSGFQVSLASDGQEALDRALQLLPDLILRLPTSRQVNGARKKLRATESAALRLPDRVLLIPAERGGRGT
jgi:DNA-binding response OmpR family regulator